MKDLTEEEIELLAEEERMKEETETKMHSVVI